MYNTINLTTLTDKYLSCVARIYSGKQQFNNDFYYIYN
jgi:hypothetical protein